MSRKFKSVFYFSSYDPDVRRQVQLEGDERGRDKGIYAVKEVKKEGKGLKYLWVRHCSPSASRLIFNCCCVFIQSNMVIVHSHWIFQSHCVSSELRHHQQSAFERVFDMADEEKKEEREPFYHYTDKDGAEGIQESGVIKKSTRDRGDAAFGDGTYVTKVKPSSSKRDIVENNYDNRTNKSWVEDQVKSGDLTLHSSHPCMIIIAKLQCLLSPKIL